MDGRMDGQREGGRREGRKEGVSFVAYLFFSSVFHCIDRLHISIIIKAESAKAMLLICSHCSSLNSCDCCVIWLWSLCTNKLNNSACSIIAAATEDNIRVETGDTHAQPTTIDVLSPDPLPVDEIINILVQPTTSETDKKVPSIMNQQPTNNCVASSTSEVPTIPLKSFYSRKKRSSTVKFSEQSKSMTSMTSPTTDMHFDDKSSLDQLNDSFVTSTRKQRPTRCNSSRKNSSYVFYW